MKGWKLNDSDWKTENTEAISLRKGNTSNFFMVKNLTLGVIKLSLSELGDIKATKRDDQIIIQSLNDTVLQISVSGLNKIKTFQLNPGKEVKFDLNK